MRRPKPFLLVLSHRQTMPGRRSVIRTYTHRLPATVTVPDERIRDAYWE
jgi:hypothetical protein